MERGRARKPADAFAVGDRLCYDGREWVVVARQYLDERRSVELALRPDRGMGDRRIFDSGEYLEVGDPPSLWQRMQSRLRR
jgi:hypothetical protein